MITKRKYDMIQNQVSSAYRLRAEDQMLKHLNNRFKPVYVQVGFELIDRKLIAVNRVSA